MKTPVRFVLAATALLALPLTLQAEVKAEECPAGKTPCCAAAKADCSATAKAECCATAKASAVTLKIKNADNAALTAALGKLDGVTSVATCAESKFTKVGYSKDKVGSDKIMAALKKAGYQIETQRVTYSVDGLACGACTDKVSKALIKVKGVSDQKVCAVSKTAVVDFNPNKVSAEKVMAAIDAAGFKATEGVN